MLFRISLNKTLILFGVLSIVGCKKQDDAPKSLEDGKSIVIQDLAGDTKASISEGIDGKEKRPFYTFLFNLQQQKQIWIRTAADSAQWFKTAQWDLAFTGNYNSEIQINNSRHVGTPGFGGTISSTAIILLSQPYQDVSTAPTDSQFDASTVTTIGWAKDGNSAGWYSYDLSSHIMKAYPNRTYALRLSNGKYAKLQILSAYKGNPPAVSDLYWPAPYLTFRYYVQEDGSRNLNTN